MVATGHGTSVADPPRTSERSRQTAVLAILSGAALMVTYVETMIIPGLPNFETFYGNAPLSSVTWILSAYLVVGVAITPTAGKLGDIYGKKRVLVALLGVYFVAVTVAGFTPNIGAALDVSRPNQLYLLIGVRAVQGVGMGMFPLAFAMIGDEFPRPKVAGAQAIVAAMFSVGAAVGLLGGAWITQEFGWQLTYHTMIPIAGVVLAMSVLLLRESRVRVAESLDIAGATTLAVTLSCFLLGLTQGPTWGWENWSGYSFGPVPFGVPELMVLAAAFLVGFVIVELRTASPIVKFSALSERNILLANTAGLFAGTAMFLLFVGLVARAEAPSPVGLGKTYLEFGLYSVPSTVTVMICGPIVGRSLPRIGPRPVMLAGSALIVLGGVFLAAYNSTVLELVMGPVPTLTGIILIYIAMTNLVVLASKPGETGIATGMNQTFRNLGTAVGPVLASTILASLVTMYTFFVTNPVNGSLVAVSRPGPSVAAFQLVFALVAVFGAICFVVSALLINVRSGGAGVSGGAAGTPIASAR
jgi:MFS family permease